MAAEAGHAANRAYNAQDGSIHLNGAAFYNDAETDVSGQLETVIGGVAAGYKIARGMHTTVAASDTVVTGLATVVAVLVQLDSDPVDGAMHVTATIGDQAGTPAAGSVLIKSWKSTDGDATLIAGTTFSKLVNWIAIGT